MSDLVVRGGQVLTPTERVDADVVIRSGWIAAVLPRDGDAFPPTDLPVVDASGMLVTPGFVDLQCNGAAGIDLTAEPERLAELSTLLPRWGVTAWLPTIVTSPPSIRTRTLAALAASQQNGVGAAALGVHFEGPFLAPERRGAHAPAHLVAPDPALVEGWSRDAGVAVVTLAPELPGAFEVIRRLVGAGVVVSLGHSSATADEATAAVDAGARWATHLFNAMPPLHHRDPGLGGVALTDERLSVGVIVDGLHLHPTVVRLAARALGQRLTLVTDAVAALGVRPGPIRLGDVEALSDGEGVRLADGTLAGSVLAMDQAIANTVRFAGVTVEAAVAAATVQPARLLGVDHERGVVAPGSHGDLVLLDDTLRVATTIIAGTVSYSRADTTDGSVTATQDHSGGAAVATQGGRVGSGGGWRPGPTSRSQNESEV